MEAFFLSGSSFKKIGSEERRAVFFWCHMHTDVSSRAFTRCVTRAPEGREKSINKTVLETKKKRIC
jgi:hypothetical protein